ncbi:RING finger protein B-like protein [Paramyrothecium foliicola]|nr:RING finger protein B-like protein [Paramyrothecium foliicola]
MKCKQNSALVAMLAMASSGAAQFQNWAPNQVNTSICQWMQPRAALVQDTIYLDGGQIVWLPGLNDGRYGDVRLEGNRQGLILSYKLTRSFDQNTNVTGILLRDTISKAVGGSGAATRAGVNFEDGALLANDNQFILYGGNMVASPGDYEPPAKDQSIGYQVYQYGPERPGWTQGFQDVTFTDDVTRYIAYGGAASAPSENKAWYFSGLASPNRGPIFVNSGDNSTRPSVPSKTLITVDMADQRVSKWTNSTIRDRDIRPRANPEVVWVPIGEKGILVVLGGVVHPHWVGKGRVSDNEEASRRESPEFMQTIDIYDVANDRWHRQRTRSGPGTRTRGCAVVAHSSDYSSFNVYYYGGFDGINSVGDFHDDVWVLSLPSFTWVRLNEGQAFHARAGHKCFTPYPDQMMVLGGYPSQAGLRARCLDRGPVVIFNMTSGQWMDSYDPTNHGDYGVPDKVFALIGGNAAGGANKTEPDSGWDEEELEELFATPYDFSKIRTFGPYDPEDAAAPRPDFPPEDNSGGGKSGLPSWVAPVLGVVLGLVLLTGAIVLFCLYRKRKIFKNRPSEAGTEDAGMRIMSWVRGQPTPRPVEKAPTITTSEEMPASSPDMRPVYPTTYSVTPTGYHEMDATHVMELDDTSLPAPRAELHNTGFTHVGVNRKRSKNGGSSQARSLSKPSSVSGDNSDFNDTVSQASGPVSNSPAPEVGLVDSPTLATESVGNTDLQERYTSGVSMISRASHLRNLSDTTVSSEGTHAEVRPAPERTSQPAVQPIPEKVEDQDEQPAGASKVDPSALPPQDQPVSPPTADEAQAEEYFSAKPIVSPIATKSAFPGNDESSERK